MPDDGGVTISRSQIRNLKRRFRSHTGSKKSSANRPKKASGRRKGKGGRKR